MFVIYEEEISSFNEPKEYRLIVGEVYDPAPKNWRKIKKALKSFTMKIKTLEIIGKTDDQTHKAIWDIKKTQILAKAHTLQELKNQNSLYFI